MIKLNKLNIKIILFFGCLLLILITSNTVWAKSNINYRPQIYYHNSRILINKNNMNHYNIFQNTSWNKFRIIKNSTHINSRLPKMKTLTIFSNVYRGGRWPQSLNVDKHGHYAYIGFDSFINDGSKIIRYNIWKHHFTLIGRTFYGGHAQAVSSDSKGRLWFINRSSNDESGDHEGPIHKGSFVEVSQQSLKPIYKKKFKFGNGFMGDNLAFAGKYGVFNVSRIWGRNHTSNHYRRHMLVIYHTNNLSQRGSKWSRLLALRNTPGFYLIQAVGYNPRNKHLYIASTEPTIMLSMPVPKLLNKSLRRKDIRFAKIHLGYKREVEGLSFDKKGYMYLLFGSPGQLLRSKRPITK